MQDNIGHTASVITDTDNAIHQLKITNLNTIFDVAAESEAQFIEKVVNASDDKKGATEPELTEKAKTLYQRAKAEVAHHQAARRAKQLRQDPVLSRINKLAFPTEPEMPIAKLQVKPRAKMAHSLVDQIPERVKEYTDPVSIQSLFSPGRYLCKLYNVAKELHEDGNKLHIDQRRPDLKDLVLSDSNMNQEVSSLEILLNVLQTKAPLAELTKDTEAHANDVSFTLPYDDNLTVINAILEDKAISLREIAALLAENNDPWANPITPALVQEQLGLNPASYALIDIKSPLDDNSAKRLAHATQLSVEQLQWLNKNAIESSSDKDSPLRPEILTIISEYRRLHQRYGLSVDPFIAIINAVNTTHTNENKTSFFQQIFSTLDVDAGFNFLDQGSWEVIIRKALGITAEELLRIAEYCFGKSSISNVKMNSKKFSQLYRMAMIPRTLGVSFSQAEYLWQLYSKPDENIMERIAQGKAMTIINAITVLENTLQWMSQQKLDVITLQAMLTKQYSTAATPELFNFLSNIYQTLGKQVYSESLKPNLYRSLANGFHLKANVVAGLVNWLAKNDTEFTLESFWKNIAMTFAEEPSLHQLEVHQPLIIQCQKLSQYVLIAQWAELSEQEIELILLPNGIDNRGSAPSPSITLLKLLSEFKRWQHEAEVSQSELFDIMQQLITGTNEKQENLRNAAEKVLRSIAKNIGDIDSDIDRADSTINIRNGSATLFSPEHHMYKALKLDISNLEKSKTQLKDKKKEEEIKLEQAKNNIKSLINDWDSEIIIRLAELYHWDINIANNMFILIFDKRTNFIFHYENKDDYHYEEHYGYIFEQKPMYSFDKKLTNGFESIVSLKYHIYIAEKLKVHPGTLIKIKNYIFDDKNNELEDIANKLIVNL
ncbi:insecticial toxin complex protein [Yersinia pseudotuberculosis]|uniref:Tc toxin subunit A n=1 Tax=Yersinia pseudotuberculosis TaxID=633 RepID=UPI0005E8C724|nr:Tc toxin subunit A [Yersinia pseudotuberculosis]CNL22109.1 insecticial toxin complex protein [Yersinia pseudotuberculosis]